MPLITMKDIESLSPIFKGEKGNKTAKRLLRLMGIDRLAEHYEKFEHLSGPDFVAAYLKDAGVVLLDLVGHAHPHFMVMANKFRSMVKTIKDNLISGEEQQECANWKDLGIKLREAVYGMDKKM